MLGREGCKTIRLRLIGNPHEQGCMALSTRSFLMIGLVTIPEDCTGVILTVSATSISLLFQRSRSSDGQCCSSRTRSLLLLLLFEDGERID